MTIALFSSSIDIRAGYGNITYEYCQQLQKKHVEFTLFLPKAEEKFVKELGVTFPVRYVLPKYVFRFNAKTIWPYLKIIDVAGFDLVHSLLDFPYCFMAARSAKKYHLPFITGSQGTYGVLPLTYWPEKHFLTWTYRQAKATVVPSTYTKNQILKYAGELYPIHIIHNGVNVERFSKPMDATAIRSMYNGKTILLTVGGIKERKGHDLVMRALGLLAKKRQDFAYLIVGEGKGTGDARPKLEALAAELGITEHVHYMGGQIGDDVLRSFEACDIYVHTPRIYKLNFEGFGIVYLEASMRRKPIVATDAGGIRDAVLDGKTGMVVPEDDVVAIAKALELLMDQPDLRQRMGKAGQEYAKQHDWSRIVDEFLSLYHTCLDVSS